MENTQKKNANHAALVCWSMLMLILVSAYVIEIFKGLRGVPYVLGLVVIGVAPLIVSWLIFKSNPTSQAIRIIMIVSYFVFYAIVLFESPYTITFTYIFPMFAIVAVFGDIKWSFATGGFGVIIVLARIIYNAAFQGHTAATNVTEYEIEFFSVFLISLFLVIASRCLSKNNEVHLKQVKMNASHAEDMNKSILEAGQSVNNSVADIQCSVSIQQENMDKTAKAIEEMTNGIEQMAENLKEQSQVTADIQNVVETIADSSTQMAQHSAKTKSLVNQNAEQLQTVKTQSEEMQSASGEVLSRLRDLEEKANSMEGILVMIGEVTENTDLLSLNASIEAARAGEVGKGFAVVADEIRGLAETTKKSALEIEELLQSFHELSDMVQSGVKDMFDGMQEQNRRIEHTYRGFAEMENSLDMLDHSANSVHTEMEHLKESNQTIVDAISDMSAVSEQIASSAKSVEKLSGDTKEAGEETGEKIQIIANQMEQLIGSDE